MDGNSTRIHGRRVTLHGLASSPDASTGPWAGPAFPQDALILRQSPPMEQQPLLAPPPSGDEKPAFKELGACRARMMRWAGNSSPDTTGFRLAPWVASPAGTA